MPARTTAILPIKRFVAAKSRLAGAVSADARRVLAAAMLTDVLAALSRVEALDRVLVVSGERVAVTAAREEGFESIDDPRDAGHSEAAGLGIDAALAAGADCVAILPGDCPLLDPGDLDRALSDQGIGEVAVIPDRHGSGTNGLILSPPGAISPAFGPGSRERHLGMADAAGVGARVLELPSLALDLDTPDDLAELSRRLREDPESAPATAEALTGLSL
jgi:2-phospho-L-lactate guanylyltransferase